MLFRSVVDGAVLVDVGQEGAATRYGEVRVSERLRVDFRNPGPVTIAVDIVTRMPKTCLRNGRSAMTSPNNKQISAYISDVTSTELEAYVEARGLKKSFVIDQAIKHHLRALRELPVEVIVPPQIVVDREVGERLLARAAKPRKPTAATLALFARRR